VALDDFDLRTLNDNPQFVDFWFGKLVNFKFSNILNYLKKNLFEKDLFEIEAPESERGDDMESLNSTFSPSSSILDFRQDPRNTQSLTGSIERRLR
jgi:hypothetical protein